MLRYEFSFCTGEASVMENVPSDLPTGEWAKKHVKVPEGPAKGAAYNPDLAPYFPPLWDLLFDPHLRTLYIVAGPQIGKTLFGQIFLARRAVEYPGPMQVWLPDEDLSEEWFDKKIIPLFEGSPSLRRKLSNDRYAIGKTEITLENGSSILARWSGSKSKRAALSARDALGDEPDLYQTGSHKDYHERLRAFKGIYKELYTGKPIGFEDESWIWGQRSEADIRLHYEACCPACSTFQKMQFEKIKVPEGERDRTKIRREKLAWYECEHCQFRWTDKVRNSAVRRGRWMADKAIDRPGVAWAHLPSWNSPWVSLSTVMSEWFEAQGNPEKMKAWWNGFAAQPMNTVVTETDEDQLRKFMVPEMPPLVVPDRACAVTISVDMQKDHFYYSTAAHGFNPGTEFEREDWIIDQGKVSDFKDLQELIFKSSFRQDGSDRLLSVWRAGVDTGGGKNKWEDQSRPVQLYNWLLKQPRGIVVGTKGMSRRTPGVLVKSTIQEKFPNGKPMKHGLALYFIDTVAFKDLLFWRLGEDSTEPICFHGKTSDAYFRQIVSEKKVIEKGKHIWKQVRANHWLDCLVGHLAMTHFQWAPAFEPMAAALLQAMRATTETKPKIKSINPYTGKEE